MQVVQAALGGGFHEVLAAPGRAPEIPAELDAYGWLVGSWALEVRHYRIDLRGQGVTGEVHFGWVLEGRAMQDVWIMPRRAQRAAAPDRSRNMYGTTLRVWDPSIEAWRVSWFNPVAGVHEEMIGRRCGDEIVQLGRHANGTPTRWRFTEIAPASFRWIGEALEADGKTWRLEGEFQASRVAP